MAVTINSTLSVVSTNASNNTANIRYVVTCTVSGSSYHNDPQTGTFVIDGTSYTSSYSLPRNSTTTVFDKTVTVGNADSRTVSASYRVPTTPSGGTKTGSNSVTIPSIPRYAYFSKNSIYATTLNTVRVLTRPDRKIYSIQYSLNGGNWTNIKQVSGDWSSPNVDTVYEVTGLQPNTKYNIRTRIAYTYEGAVAGLYTISNTLEFTTKDIGRISSVANFNHGSGTSIGITNPSGAGLSLAMKIGNTQIFSRTVTKDTTWIGFNDTELDNIYKLYGSSNSLTATFILTTSGGYTNSRTCTISLKGDQKTIKTRISGTWRRGKVWTKVSGTWRRCVVWVKINGVWRRCI